MPEFKDAKGDRWTVSVNGATVKRALEMLQVDLGKPLEGKPLDGKPVEAEPPLLTRFDLEIAFKVDLLYVVCKPQADERGLTDVQFAERLDGDALYDASQAFMEAWANFCRSLRQGWLAKAIEKQQEAQRAIFDAAERKFSDVRLDEAVEAKVKGLEETLDAEIARLGSSSASSPPSPGATPSPEPSES